MECGVPFCQSHTGCPLGNIIPRWNDLVFQVTKKNQQNGVLYALPERQSSPEEPAVVNLFPIGCFCYRNFHFEINSGVPPARLEATATFFKQ